MQHPRTIVVEGPCQGSWSKAGSYPDYALFIGRPDFPARPIDWRWFVTQDCPQAAFTDPAICLVQRYLATVRNAGGFIPADADEELQRLHEAWTIWDARRWARMELESRVLARQSCDEIAELMGLPVECVRLYESVFFDIRDRSQASGFIVTAALGGSDIGSPQRPLYDVMKQFAYSGGPVILDTALRAARATPEELEGDDDDTDLLRLFRLNLIMEQVPMNQVTGPHLLNLPAARSRGQAHWLNAVLRMLDEAYASIDLMDADLWPALRKVYVEYGLKEPESHEAVKASSSDAAAVAGC